MSVLFIGLLLAATFAGLNVMLRQHSDERTYNRITVALAGMIIVIAWGIFAAIQLGFIKDHYP